MADHDNHSRSDPYDSSKESLSDSGRRHSFANSTLLRCLCLLVFLCGLAHVSLAGTVRRIELIDGSVITGEVVSLSGGVYTINSPLLGLMRLEESKIRSIGPTSPEGALAGQGPSQGVGGNAKEEVDALRGAMMSDQDIMGIVLALHDDPAFKKVLQDPAIMKAVNSGDLAALMSNPEFMKLLSHPKVREIKTKLGE
jgi:hypothetical protein